MFFHVLQKESNAMNKWTQKKWTKEDEKDAITIVLIIRYLFLLLMKGGALNEKLTSALNKLKEKFAINCDDRFMDYSEAKLEARKVEEENSLIALILDEFSTEEKKENALNEVLRLLENCDFQKTKLNKALLTYVVKLGQSLVC